MPFTSPRGVFRTLLELAFLTVLGDECLAAASLQNLPSPALWGVVIDDATGQPVERATVELIGGGAEAVTGASGTFEVGPAPRGLVSLRISAPGHPSVVESVEILESGFFLEIRMPSVQAVLDEVLVLGRRAAQRSEVTARTAADLLMPKILSAHPPTTVGVNDRAINLRAANSISRTAEPLVLIDGVVVSDLRNALDALAFIRASDVEEIQVLRGAAATSMYPLASNGVVVVTTKHGG